MATSRTATNLINDVLRLLHVYNPSETPSSADAAQGLATLQDMLAGWSAEGLVVPFETTEYLSTVAAQEEYTVGENGSPSKNTVAPTKVIGAWIRISDVDYPVQLIGEREYRLLQDKTTSGQPDRMWVKYTAPNVTFSVYPSPDAVYTLYFTSLKPFTEPTAGTTDLLNTSLIPREFFNAVKFNLALDLAPYFEIEPGRLLLARAASTKAHLVSLNLARTMEPARLELTGGSDGNILNPPA